MKHLIKFNESVEWKEDFDDINDIINIARDDNVFTRVNKNLGSKLGKYCIIYLSSFTYPTRYRIDWDALFPYSRNENPEIVRLCDVNHLLNISSEVMRRIQNLGYNTDVRAFSSRSAGRKTNDPVDMMGDTKSRREIKLVTIKIYD